MKAPFKHHLLLCTQHCNEDKPHCVEQGSDAVLVALERELRRQGLADQVVVTPCGCLGLCARGPNLVVYPEGVWYCGVTAADVEQLVSAHLVQGQPVQRLLAGDAEGCQQEVVATRRRALARQAAHAEAGVLPEGLRRLAGDFWASRAFLTAVELDLFSAVNVSAAAEVADRLGTDQRATGMLLDALVALGLLSKNDDHYANTEQTARYLRRGVPDDARAALMNRVHMWDRWSTLTECVREGGSMGVDHGGPSSTKALIAATHRIANLAAPALVAALNLQGIQRMLDLGAGSGAYTMAVLKAHPEATAELLDLPAVLRVATRNIREAGLEQRVTLRAEDFQVAPLGSGFDLVLLSYVMHLYPAESNRRLLARAFDALAPGGRLVIHDYVLNADKTAPRHAALYALNMLVTTRAGSVCSLDEHRADLEVVGFSAVQKVSMLGPTDVITALKL